MGYVKACISFLSIWSSADLLADWVTYSCLLGKPLFPGRHGGASNSGCWESPLKSTGPDLKSLHTSLGKGKTDQKGPDVLGSEALLIFSIISETRS